ncbi:MAG TPA: histidine--tRNA ligase [Spirochaetota bacterium]|nr:histidine--tRNA ligase [Spirochaetota bacterium]OPZ38463.1 MAG: Histidine--tRNA ligase [Spirochaetes bacterium ADurb.BinA120]HNU90990.1 histidine--tRNA ligase [Spirochaetota bacterium]HPI15303.1 histidine--tRNA ligase [Spirochaetota bacterium]HPO44581.1 histidine--tRNA ligase [Spirochaetota bacterium]
MLTNPPGIEDIFPDRMDAWSRVIGAAREVFRLSNYREIIIPVMEYTEVFARGLGDETDIVTKEMFTFEDRGGRSLTLRPEGTASVVRAYVSNGDYNRLSSAKFYYCGPMFRAERPQKGRLRQFNQFGAEFFGSPDPYYDYEIIAMMHAISRRVGIEDFALLLNSIGCGSPDCRGGYVVRLKSYFEERRGELCEDCRRRLEKNPLRILDCKQEGCASLKKGAPSIADHLCAACRGHYAGVKEHLNAASIQYREDPFLVRGLDYYTRTTFEFVTDRLGGQNAFAAGGRYDSLVESFGGRPTPAVGFAAGVERMLLVAGAADAPGSGLDVYLVHAGGEALRQALELARTLREAGISADLDPQGKSFKNQLKKADRESARFTVIIGEDEAAGRACSLKNMATGEQEKIPAQMCAAMIRKALPDYGKGHGSD